MRLLLRFFGLLFAAGTIIFIVAVAAAAGFLWHYSKSLPDYSQLQDYEPAVMTRVHASDGSLLAEYARERRLYIPIQAVPKLVINAFISAEDKNFYEHPGIDFTGMARAGMFYLQNFGKGRRPQGASTITQQVAKNFLLTNEVSIDRKIKEALLALKIERTYSKDKILELRIVRQVLVEMVDQAGNRTDPDDEDQRSCREQEAEKPEQQSHRRLNPRPFERHRLRRSPIPAAAP